jgi:hypothetical protein
VSCTRCHGEPDFIGCDESFCPRMPDNEDNHMSYDTQSERLAEHFLSDHRHTPEQVADLAQTIQDAVEGWFTLNEPRHKSDTSLGFVAEVTRRVAEGVEYHAATHFFNDDRGVSPATICALRSTDPELRDFHNMLMAEKHGGNFKCDGWRKGK